MLGSIHRLFSSVGCMDGCLLQHVFVLLFYRILVCFNTCFDVLQIIVIWCGNVDVYGM